MSMDIYPINSRIRLFENKNVNGFAVGMYNPARRLFTRTSRLYIRNR